ncbi:MAG TPA: hypothetical protein ACFYDZ_08350, partial [Candidatus Brocadiaceae bacterium]
KNTIIIGTLVRYEVWFFLLGLMSAVTYKILIGKIKIKRLLVEKNGSSNYSQVRVQLLFFTLIAAFYYLSQVFGNPKEFPKVSEKLLLLMGGSNMVYLGGKSYSLLFSRRR